MSPLAELFYRGDYSRIVELTVDTPHQRSPTDPMASFDSEAWSRDDLHLIVGALSFLGRLADADRLVRMAAWQALSDDARIEGRFYHAVGYCRHSCYIQAAQYFFENLRFARKGTARQRFFVFQGLGFYSFFQGRFLRAAKFASRACDAAFEINFTYGRALSEDLFGHSLIQVGRVREGLESLRQARNLASVMGSGGFARATLVSDRLYRAQHGLLEDPIDELQKLIRGVSPQNNYSKTYLYLELAQQQILSGQRVAAESTLDHACELVYGAKNRRQGAMLNHRYAWIQVLKGDDYQALNLIRSGIAELNPEVDRAQLIQMRGFECAISERLGLGKECDSDLIRLTKSTGRAIARRIEARHEAPHEGYGKKKREPGLAESTGGVVRKGEDPLGDLFDLVSTASSAPSPQASVTMEKIAHSGYWGLFHRCLGLPPHSTFIALNPVPGGALIHDHGEVHFAESGLSASMSNLLEVLSEGPATKEMLVSRMWGYDYHPHKHDPLVYRLISRVRLLLGPFASWLVATDAGYALPEGIKVIRVKGSPLNVSLPAELSSGRVESVSSIEWGETPSTPPPTEPVLSSHDGIPNSTPSERLNPRQVLFVDFIKSRESVNAREYQDHFHVSEATARRDLAELCKLNIITRQGKARATSYCYAGEWSAK